MEITTQPIITTQPQPIITHMPISTPTTVPCVVNAGANDIIQYNASTGKWFVSFDASESTSVEYVTNLTTSIQYRYVQTEGLWMKSYEGWYDQGDYSIVI